MGTLCSSKIIKIVLLLLSLLFFIRNESTAENSIDNEINGLYQKFYSAETDTDKVNGAIEIFVYYQYIRLDSLLILAKKTYNLSKSIGYKQALTTKALGIAYSLNGDFTNGNNYLIEAFQHAQTTKNTNQMCAILGAIGTNYFDMNENDKALEYFKKALELSYNYHSRQIMLLNLGQAHAELHNFPEALENLQKALTLAENEKSDVDIAITYNRFAELYLIKKDYNQSLDYFKKALEMDVTDRLYEFRINCMYGIARGYNFTHRFNSGVEMAQKALSLATSENYLHYQVRACQILSFLYDSIGRADRALYYYKQYSTFNDSLFNIEKTKNINFLNTEFETTQKELQIAALEREATLTRTLNIVYSIIACLVLLVLFFVIKSYRQKNRMLGFEKKALEYEKTTEALEKEQLKIKLFEKDRELLTKILQINQQKEALTIMMQEANKILKKDSLREIYNSVKQLNSNISAKLVLCDDWNQIMLHFDKVHPGFFKNLKSSSEDLTHIDMKLCAYTKLKFSAKDISRLLNVNHRSVIMARYRIKKKLNIPAEVGFDDFIENR